MSSSNIIRDKYRLNNSKPRNDAISRNRPLSHLELLASETESDEGNEEEAEEEEEEEGEDEDEEEDEKDQNVGKRKENEIDYPTEILENLDRASAKKINCQKDFHRGLVRKRTDCDKNLVHRQLTSSGVQNIDRSNSEFLKTSRPKENLVELRADKLLLLKYGRDSLANGRPRSTLSSEYPRTRPKSSVETIENVFRSGCAKSNRFSLESSPPSVRTNMERNSSGLNSMTVNTAKCGSKDAPARNKPRTPVRSKSWLSERDWRNLNGGGAAAGTFLKSSRSDYERALSSLLWQPYECRSETTTTTMTSASSRNLDDSDVSYWLNSPSTWSRELYRDHSNTSSLSSLSSSSSSELSLETMNNDTKLRGPCSYSQLDYKCREHDSNSSSLCGLINSPATPDYRFHGNGQVEWSARAAAGAGAVSAIATAKTTTTISSMAAIAGAGTSAAAIVGFAQSHSQPHEQPLQHQQMQMVSDLNSVLLCFTKPPPGAGALLRESSTGSVSFESRSRRQSEPSRVHVGSARSDVANTMLVNIETGAPNNHNNSVGDISCSSISNLVDNISSSSSVGVVSAVPISVQNKCFSKNINNNNNNNSVSNIPPPSVIADINCDFGTGVSNSLYLSQQPPASVTCYRAVPATVSSVPSILCQNSSNVANIRINDNQNSAHLTQSNKHRVPSVHVNSNNNTSSVQNIYIPPTSTNSPVYTLQSQNPPKNSHSRQFSDIQSSSNSQQNVPVSKIGQNVTLHCNPVTSQRPKTPSESASVAPCNVDQIAKPSTHNQSQAQSPQSIAVPAHSPQQSLTSPQNSWTPDVRPSANRTFTSTEAQTDDVIVNSRDSATRDQRRRERRERRHQQRLLMNSLQRTSLNGSQEPPSSWHPQTQIPVLAEPERLPDILNSHLPPPYSTLPPASSPATGQFPLNSPPPPNVSVLLNSGSNLTSPASPQHPQTPPSIASGFRFPFAIVPNSRRRRDCMNVWSNWTQEMRSRLGGRESHYTPEEEPKSCCGVSLSQTLAIRWFILVVFFLGLCCAVVGSVLGVMRISGREHLTVSILMIGVGIVLVAVSGVAWRMTSRDAPSCRVMLGLGAGEEGIGEPNRRFVPRLPPTYGRPHHPYAAMMYPEFQYRAPPPSYQASMQEYRLRLLLLDRNNGPLNTVSPPPTYRSHPGTILRPPMSCRREPICHPPNQLDYSRPPSYRSRTSSTRPSCNLDPNAGDIGGSISTTHSRNPSQLSISDSGGNTVNVITVIGTRSASDTDSENIIKMVPDEAPLSGSLNLVSSKKDGSETDIVKDSPSNIVTIVQSTPETNGSVIVTVTGTTTDTTTSSHTCDTEMQILAHL